MASNLFGTPITDISVKEMSAYRGKTITRRDRAHVAFILKNAAKKDVDARTFVEKLKEEWGNGVATLCLIYNATGDTIKLIKTHDYHGHIGPSPYPSEIGNGQWGAFLHVKTSGAAAGSSGVIAYRGLNNNDSVCEWMGSWSNPWSRIYNNTVYTEIQGEGYYEKFEDWDMFFDTYLSRSGITHSCIRNECVSDVSTGNGTTAVFEAIFTLDGAK